MRGLPEYRPRRTETFLETELGFNTREFEMNAGVSVESLQRLSYDRFKDMERGSLKRGIEVAVSTEASSIFIFPPRIKPFSYEDLAVMTLPAVHFLRRYDPNMVIGCDRGARPYGIAVHTMWARLGYGPFPTADAKLPFARLSTSLDEDVVDGQIERLIAMNQKATKRRGEEGEPEKLGMVFIEDLVASGRTRNLILKSLERTAGEEKVDAKFIVMCGGSGDVTGSEDRVDMFWHDKPNVMGVDYDEEGYPFPVVTEDSKIFRMEIHVAVRDLANQVKMGRVPDDQTETSGS
jgi:hypothetical protein